MVHCIQLAIPPGMETVFNPIEDAALMARVGARRTGPLTRDRAIVGSVYELNDAASATGGGGGGGTTFELRWWSVNSHHFCKIERK